MVCGYAFMSPGVVFLGIETADHVPGSLSLPYSVYTKRALTSLPHLLNVHAL